MKGMKGMGRSDGEQKKREKFFADRKKNGSGGEDLSIFTFSSTFFFLLV